MDDYIAKYNRLAKVFSINRVRVLYTLLLAVFHLTIVYLVLFICSDIELYKNNFIGSLILTVIVASLYWFIDFYYRYIFRHRLFKLAYPTFKYSLKSKRVWKYATYLGYGEVRHTVRGVLTQGNLKIYEVCETRQWMIKAMVLYCEYSGNNIEGLRKYMSRNGMTREHRGIDDKYVFRIPMRSFDNMMCIHLRTQDEVAKSLNFVSHYKEFNKEMFERNVDMITKLAEFCNS